MLILMITSVLATKIMWNAQIYQRQAESTVNSEQIMMMLQSAEAWAGNILYQDKINTADLDYLGEIWANELPPMPIDGGYISGKIIDLQSRFNVNNLINTHGDVDSLADMQFRRLLTILEIDPNIASAVIDWIDPDNIPNFPNGAEDDVYSANTPPYRSPNVSITSTSELMAMDGITKEVLMVLEPHIAALPSGTPQNINTSSAYIIASLSDEIDINQAIAISQERGSLYFANVNERFESLIEPDMLRRLTSSSEYFLLEATVTIGSDQNTLYSLLYRDISGIVKSVYRSLGAS
ncbi:MAG: hypothetical protein CBC38_00500 [Gammaproteobacteria bacterium TMED78]|nr:MAG: hypothetical protein CBC38_00500 [Gammaproteobacteria bacterium TMED78]